MWLQVTTAAGIFRQFYHPGAAAGGYTLTLNGVNLDKVQSVSTAGGACNSFVGACNSFVGGLQQLCGCL